MPLSQPFAGWLSVAALLSVSVLPGQANSAVLHVATNANLAGPGCGSVDRPCRSISAAARNAVNGDSIEVGPGVYGDIDGDGDATASGEESTVVIDKAVNVYSLEGAARTIIRSPRIQQRSRVVLIGSAGAGGSFGRPDGGFTIVGDKSAAPGGTGGLQNNASDMTIAGNVFTNNASYGLVSASPRVRVEGNIAADNGGTGFDLASTDLVATGNLAARNQIGFALNARWTTFSDNQALANVQFGVQINTGNVAEIKFDDHFGGFERLRLFEQSARVGEIADESLATDA